MNYDELESGLWALANEVKAQMSPKRFAHTLSVVREVTAIGRHILPDRIRELQSAALLHDVTKQLSPDAQIALCRSLGAVLDADALRSLATLHQKTAPFWIQRHAPDFASDDILHAVSVHATGDADMSLFDKILFLGDYIEADRQYESCKQVRWQFWNEVGADPIGALDGAVRETLRRTLVHLAESGSYIDPLTVRAYNGLLASEALHFL